MKDSTSSAVLDLDAIEAEWSEDANGGPRADRARALVAEVRRLREEAARLRHERDALGGEIVTAAIRSGQLDSRASITGPRAILLVRGMADATAGAREEARLWKALAQAHAEADEHPRLLPGWCAARERIDSARRQIAASGLDPDNALKRAPEEPR